MEVRVPSFEQTVRREEYIAARKALAKKTGVGRYCIPMFILAAAALCGAAVTVWPHPESPYYWLTGGGMALAGVVIVLIWTVLLPRDAAKRAAADFPAYDRLQNGVIVSLYADYAEWTTEAHTRRTTYAEAQVCLETPARFVVLQDSGAVLIFEKESFADRDATCAFLRRTFARVRR
ncbi:MAG: hypothetical protein IJU16_03460 [Clostridia bacterium]|nr:hypothetical protein [Clostridia bacterium]